MPITSLHKRILLGILCLAFIWIHAIRMYALHPSTYGEGDFTVFYSATEVLLVDQNPYKTKYVKKYIRQHRPYEAGFRYLYPPTAALFFVPLVALPFTAAAHVWALINTLLFFVIVFFLQGIRGKRFTIDEWIAVVGLFLLFFPLFTNNRLGQVNLMLTTLFVAHIYFAARNKLFISGALVASMIAIKVFPGIIMVYYFLRRDWKMLFITAGFLGMIAAVTALLFSPEVFMNYIQRLTNISTQGIGTTMEDIISYNNPTLNGTIHRILVHYFPLLSQQAEWLPGLVRGIRLAAMGLIGGVGVLLQKKGVLHPVHAMSLLFSVVFFSAAEIHTQYFVFLIPSLVLLFIDSPKRLRNAYGVTGVALATLLMGVSYIRFVPKNLVDTFITVVPTAFIGNGLYIALIAYAFTPLLFKEIHKAVIILWARYRY